MKSNGSFDRVLAIWKRDFVRENRGGLEPGASQTVTSKQDVALHILVNVYNLEPKLELRLDALFLVLRSTFTLLFFDSKNIS